MTIIEDYDTLKKRRITLEAGGTIDTSQMPLDTYLDRLSSEEREGLVKIIDELLYISTLYFRNDSYLYSVFGGGTTTYDDEHWETLKKYIGNDDKNKHIIENKGEDIDIVICPEHCGDSLIKYTMEKQYMERFNKKHKPTQRRIFYDRKKIREKINKNKFGTLTPDEEFVWKEMYDIRTMITGVAIMNKWKHTPWTDGASFGAQYLPVPEKFVKTVGSNVVRIKGENWGVENTVITMPNCRPFHIYVDDIRCRAHKIEYERIINLPFALLFSPYTKQHFQDLVAKKNGTYIKRPKIEPYNTLPENSIDEFPF